MQTIRWADEATTDLVEIIDYIVQRNATAAQNLHAAIVQSAENLPLMPAIPLMFDRKQRQGFADAWRVGVRAFAAGTPLLQGMGGLMAWGLGH